MFIGGLFLIFICFLFGFSLTQFDMLTLDDKYPMHVRNFSKNETNMDEITLILNYKGKKHSKELKEGVISLKIAIFQISKWVLGLGKSFFQFTHTVNKIFKPRKEKKKH